MFIFFGKTLNLFEILYSLKVFHSLTFNIQVLVNILGVRVFLMDGYCGRTITGVVDIHWPAEMKKKKKKKLAF